MALKCTKTSGPPSREMKPKPFASLNHFTVPLMRAMNRTSYRAMEPDRACEGIGRFGRRSSHVIPVMPRRAMLRLSGRDVPLERASFVHTEVCGRARHVQNAK